MKKVLFSILLLASISLTALSQTDFVTYVGPGNLITNTGETFNGKVVYSLSSPGKVRVIFDDKTDKTFNYNETKEFTVNDRHYYAIKVKIVGNPNTFAQLLNPESSSLIKVYRNEQQPTIVVDRNFTITTSYYIGLPNQDKAIETGDLKMMPFNKKMAEVVKDCPALAKKIMDKEDGYKMGMMSVDLLRIPVYLRIAKEFDACK